MTNRNPGPGSTVTTKFCANRTLIQGETTSWVLKLSAQNWKIKCSELENFVTRSESLWKYRNTVSQSIRYLSSSHLSAYHAQTTLSSLPSE